MYLEYNEIDFKHNRKKLCLPGFLNIYIGFVKLYTAAEIETQLTSRGT